MHYKIKNLFHFLSKSSRQQIQSYRVSRYSPHPLPLSKKRHAQNGLHGFMYLVLGQNMVQFLNFHKTETWSVYSPIISETNSFYRKFSIKGARRGGKVLGALSLERGQFHLPEALYRMKIGLFLAEIWPKTSKNPIALGSKREGAPL